MKTVEVSVLNSIILKHADKIEVTVEDNADVIDVLAAVDRRFSEIIGNKEFPIKIYNNLLHLLFNPETEEFYVDVAVEARDKESKWLAIINDMSMIIPDQSYIYLIPDAGC